MAQAIQHPHHTSLVYYRPAPAAPPTDPNAGHPPPGGVQRTDCPSSEYGVQSEVRVPLLLQASLDLSPIIPIPSMRTLLRYLNFKLQMTFRSRCHSNFSSSRLFKQTAGSGFVRYPWRTLSTLSHVTGHGALAQTHKMQLPPRRTIVRAPPYTSLPFLSIMLSILILYNPPGSLFAYGVFPKVRCRSFPVTVLCPAGFKRVCN